MAKSSATTTIKKVSKKDLKKSSKSTKDVKPVEESSSSASESESEHSSSESDSESDTSTSSASAESESGSSSSDNDSDSSSSDNESDSSSSDNEVDYENKDKVVKKDKKVSSSKESDSESSDAEKEEKETSASSSSSSSDNDEASDASSSEESDSEESQKKESSDESTSSSSDSESSSEEEEQEESPASEEKPSKKRKHEDVSEEPTEKKSKSDASSSEPATIFVGRLSWSIDDQWLKNEFEHIGGVLSARVIYERGSDRSRGYGYVDFVDKEHAEKAVKEMQGKEIDGRPINCDMSTSKPANTSNNDRAKKYGDVPSQPSDTLFLGNLSFNADRDQLFELFGKHGSVISVRIPTHPETNQPKGFGYVQYSSMEEAQTALDALQGEYIDNRPVRLDFSSPKAPSSGNGNNYNNNANRPRGGRKFGSGANNAPLGNRQAAPAFKGTKKTFD